MSDRDVTTLELDDDQWSEESNASAAAPKAPDPAASGTVAANTPPRRVAPPAPSRRAAEAVKPGGPAPDAAPPRPASPKLPVVKPSAAKPPAEGARPALPSVARPAPPPASPRAAVPAARGPAPQVSRAVKTDAPVPVAPVPTAPAVAAAKNAETPPDPPSEPSHVRGTQPRPEPNAPAAPENRDWLAHLLDTALVEESQVPEHATSSAPPVLSPNPASQAAAANSTPSTPASVAAEVRAPRVAKGREVPVERGLCAFWVKDRCFALDVDLVGEVVNVESVVPVPMAHPAMMGLFNLRGTPVALVDLALALSLDDRASGSRRADARNVVALVFRSSRMVAAAIIDRMEAVLPAGRDFLTVPEAADNPLVKGFIEPQKRDGVTVTVLDPLAVVERLERLRYA